MIILRYSIPYDDDKIVSGSLIQSTEEVRLLSHMHCERMMIMPHKRNIG